MVEKDQDQQKEEKGDQEDQQGPVVEVVRFRLATFDTCACFLVSDTLPFAKVVVEEEAAVAEEAAAVVRLVLRFATPVLGFWVSDTLLFA